MILYSYIWCNKLCKRSQVRIVLKLFLLAYIHNTFNLKYWRIVRIRIFFNPQIFLCGFKNFHVHTYPYSNRINFPFPARIRLVSGFTLVPRTPLGKLATKLSMRRKAREIWPIQPGRSQKNAKSKVDSSTGKREEVFILNRVFTVKNWARSYYVTILGDPGADKGGEGKSKRAEKYIWNEEK